VGAALTAQADSGRIDAAINEARKIRSPSEPLVSTHFW
jgi:hypothetical protein